MGILSIILIALVALVLCAVFALLLGGISFLASFSEVIMGAVVVYFIIKLFRRLKK